MEKAGECAAGLADLARSHEVARVLQFVSQTCAELREVVAKDEIYGVRELLLRVVLDGHHPQRRARIARWASAAAADPYDITPVVHEPGLTAGVPGQWREFHHAACRRPDKSAADSRVRSACLLYTSDA